MKRLITLAILFAISSHAFAWSHSGSTAGARRAAHMRSNTSAHYGGRMRR
jgi:hypothetical protein